MANPAPTAALAPVFAPAANLSAETDTQAPPADPEASPAVPVNQLIEADPDVCWPIFLLSIADTEYDT